MDRHCNNTLWARTRRATFTACIVLVVALGYKWLVIGFHLSEADVIGLTKDQVLQRCGNPSYVFPEGDTNERWVYYRGVLGSADCLYFDRDRVARLAVRYGK
jgi:hypothetical protein